MAKKGKLVTHCLVKCLPPPIGIKLLTPPVIILVMYCEILWKIAILLNRKLVCRDKKR